MSSSPITYVIALYIRLSSEDNKVGSFSIENQKNALHQYVDAMEGVKNVEVLEFIDNGYSGTNFERPAVQELLDQMREGKINCIIVKDFTRFGRNSIEVGYFMEMVFPPSFSTIGLASTKGAVSAVGAGSIIGSVSIAERS